MREEHIDYKDGGPINIYLAEIDNYPLHWHDAIEIVFVLEGKIDIEIGTETYYIASGELEIVNHNEVHSLKSYGENLVLIMNINPDFFENYYEGAREVFFYADSSEKEVQKTERYAELRNYIAILFYEYISRYEDSKEVIEEKLLSMMYYLLNNFHYLFYEEESLRDDDLELERYHRIVRYISNNYMNRVSLQEIADQEFLTSQYLSFKIKNTFGYGFNDFLNLTRVEESIKLLLNTDKNISEISEEVGFSHVRYYNKHFRLHYNMSPMEYRKKYQLTGEELEKLMSIRKLPLEKGIAYLGHYLETYERYEYDERINKYDIDLKLEAIDNFNYPSIINLGGGRELLNVNKRSIIADAMGMFNFSYGLVESLDGLIDKGPSGDRNWYELEGLIDFIGELGLEPIFILDGYEDILAGFLDYLRLYRKDLDLSKIRFVNSKELYKDRPILYRDREKKNDTLYTVGDIFSRHGDGKEPIARLIDNLPPTINSSNTFFGGAGLMTYNGLKKPSFYAYNLMSYLGREVVLRDEGLLVTRSEDSFEILLFDPLDHKKEEKKSHIGQKKRFSLNILNLDEDYRVIRYELNKDSGSVYDKWDYLGRPRIINRSYMELLEESTIPEIKFYYAKKQTVYNIVTTVKDRGASLYIFKKVQ